MWLRALPVVAATGLVWGCAGAVHQLPQVDQTNLNLAQSEVERNGAPRRRAVSDDEVNATLTSALARIKPAATQLCQEMSIGVCDWRFRTLKDRSMNAGAGPNGLIVVNRGIVEYADNEEQVALVIAHEIGHQAANHVERGLRNQAVGAIVGAVVLGAIGALASSGNRNSTAITVSAVQAGSSIGALVGTLSFSKEQEREADYLAAVILYRSGVDLDKARGFLLKMAAGSGRRETGMLDTHPAGPEPAAILRRNPRALSRSTPDR
jgi:predicted Zn-dependent protease